jgi:hypothetical protein
MAMTRKDYIVTANILKRFVEDESLEVEDLVADFVKMFADDNPRFNSRIFYSAVFGED